MGKVLENVADSGLDLAKAAIDTLLIGSVLYLMRDSGTNPSDYQAVIENLEAAKGVGIFGGLMSLWTRTCMRYFPDDGIGYITQP